MMNELKLTLTVEEVNVILESLGNQPFNKVFQLIGNIQQQAASQLGENGSAKDTIPEKEVKNE